MLLEVAGLLLLLLVYGWAVNTTPLPVGKELYLLESAREALLNPGLYYPTYNHNLHIPVSPLLSVITSLLFWVMGTAIFSARVLVLVFAAASLVLFYMLGSRTFHQQVGMLSAGFLLATWGFFYNSHIANGAVLYFGLICLIFLLFFHWFDSAYRSRTYAKSLFPNFILIGLALGLAFCASGIPGVLFPLAVMATTLAISNRMELAAEVHYAWLWGPFLLVVGIWCVLGAPAVGFVPFVLAQVRFQPNITYLLEPVLYILPVLPFLAPALFTKDIWSRAVVSYQKTLYLLVAWLGWGLVFLLLCRDYHEAFSLLVICPAVLWVGFYLSEIFRNPLFPMALQLVLDSLILGGFVASIAIILLTFQLAPPSLFGHFVTLSFALAVSSILLLLLKELTISRVMPFYLIPCSLLLCVLLQSTLLPLFQSDPNPELLQAFPTQEFASRNLTILHWQDNPEKPSIWRLISPMKTKVAAVNNRTQLESLIQTRSGPLYLILPEKQFYDLPYGVKESGYLIGTSWQWREPLSVFTLLHALSNEMLDFNTLAEPVYLFQVPADAGN